jgi:dinuclear metal center YbgI/SA1388 family protein
MKIKALTQFLEKIAPLHLQENYDNAGLIVGDFETEIRGVLFCLDSTEAIIEEAIRTGCNVVVAHHPIIFRGLKKINGKNYVERTIILAIKNDIAIYAIHTNLDNVLQNGVNQRFAERLGLNNLQILSPKKDLVSPNPNIGAGVIGTLEKPVSELDFLHFIKEKMAAGVVRHTELQGKMIEKVAICGGSGSFLLPDAIRAGAQIFVTADFKYHEFFDADSQIIIADIGHFESEQFTINLFCELFNENFSTFALRLAETRTNPVFYL